MQTGTTEQLSRQHYIDEAQAALFSEWIQRAAIWGAGIFLCLGFLDYISTPENLSKFMAYRVGIASALLLKYFFIGRLHDKRLEKLVFYIMVAASAATMELMILDFGGHRSVYYVGMIIIGIVVIAFIPASLAFHSLIAATIYGIYLVPILLLEPISDVRGFLTSNILLVFSLLTMLILRSFSALSLKSELGLKYDLGRQQALLEQKVDEKTLDLKLTILCLEREVNERARVEKEISRAYAVTRNIIEHSPFGIYVVNNRGRIEYVNQAMLMISGTSFEKFIGNNVYELPSYVSLGLSGEIREVMNGKSFYFGPVEYTSHVGKRMTVRNFVGVPYEEGEERKALIFVEDITERVRTEEAFRESEKRFSEVFEQDEDALLMFLPGTGEIIDVNPSAVRLYGYRREDFLKRGLGLILDPSALTALAGDLASLDRAGSVMIDRMTSRGRTRGDFLVSVRVKKLSLSQRDVMYCSLRDITERLRLEEDSRLMQAKLIQANKMTALGTLVSGVAHEINNPNNFILFNSQLLKDAWDDLSRILEKYGDEYGHAPIGGIPFSETGTVIPKLLDGIAEGALRIKNIIDNLKSFARREQAGIDVSLDVNSIISTAAAILTPEIRKQTDRFTLSLSDGLPPIRGNGQQIEQVMINLIMNALQALTDRKQAVRITSAFDPKCNEVLILIADEGRGIPDEMRERIMDPFFTTRLDEGGTGLGLSISYSIIQNHHGSIVFRSAPGRGTEVALALPAVNQDERAIA